MEDESIWPRQPWCWVDTVFWCCKLHILGYNIEFYGWEGLSDLGKRSLILWMMQKWHAHVGHLLN
jgi:hypothetical protein